jgi:hypothetical protein
VKLKRWLVFTERAINGTHWHAFWTRAERRAFVKQHGGERFDVIRSPHG